DWVERTMNALTWADRRRSATFALLAAIALVALATVFSPRTAGADTPDGKATVDAPIQFDAGWVTDRSEPGDWSAAGSQVIVEIDGGLPANNDDYGDGS